jgi:hypothetical protein
MFYQESQIRYTLLSRRARRRAAGHICSIDIDLDEDLVLVLGFRGGRTRERMGIHAEMGCSHVEGEHGALPTTVKVVPFLLVSEDTDSFLNFIRVYIDEPACCYVFVERTTY